MNENIACVVMISILCIFALGIYQTKKYNSKYEYKILYNCSWNGCNLAFSNDITEKNGCLVTDNLTICTDYTVKKQH